MSTSVQVLIVVAVFFLALAAISMLRLLIPKAQVWQTIRWGIYIEKTPKGQDPDEKPVPFDEQPTQDIR